MMCRSIRQIALAIMLAALSWQARAFGLDDLQAQLQSAKVVRGDFIQEKFLRSLSQPLTSRGAFTLVTGQGLLWRAQSPIALDMRITAQGIARREPDGTWRNLPTHNSGGRESKLFLAVLAGDTRGLQDNFNITIAGDGQAWKLVLTPRSALLKQIFDRIHISGGPLVDTIDLIETQGDRSVLRMMNARAAAQLSNEERRAFAD